MNDIGSLADFSLISLLKLWISELEHPGGLAAENKKVLCTLNREVDTLKLALD